MPMRLSGLMSGMDTESIIQQLVDVRSKKVTTVKNAQTKLEWKQDIWKGLNAKLKTLQSKLNNMRFSGDYAKKKTTVSDSGVASVLTSDSAMDGVHTLEVNQLAKSAYMTGGKILTRDERLNTDEIKVQDLIPGIGAGDHRQFDVSVGGGAATTIQVTGNTSVTNLLHQLREAGLNAEYDQDQGKILYNTDNNAPVNFSGSTMGLLQAGQKRSTGTEVTALTEMRDLMSFERDASGNEIAKRMTLFSGDKKVDIELTSSTTISDVLNKMREAGVNASFDAKQERFFIGSKDSGASGNFLITGDTDALDLLGLDMTKSGDRVMTRSGTPARGASRLADLQMHGSAYSQPLTLTKADGSTVNINLNPNATIDDLVTQMKNAGVNAVFDNNQQKFFFDNDIVGISGDQVALDALGLGNVDDSMNAAYVRGQDAKITLDGAVFENNSNVFDINGLTITAQNTTEPGRSVTLTTSQDTDGIYDMIKDFFKSYNEIINEIDKLYNAKAAKDFEPLSDEEKQNMSETEIEKYEQKIKDALLRNDSSLSSLGSELKKIMLGGFSVNGKDMYLTHFGIGMLSYFTAPENERNAYHIDGDSDDTETSANEDKLKKMITADPDSVISFFTQLSQKLYSKMNDLSASVEGYRSFGSFYDDKKMKADYDDYKSKIKTQEDKLAAYEDKWYKKFAKMETAMAKMQNNVSAVTSMLGGGS